MGKSRFLLGQRTKSERHIVSGEKARRQNIDSNKNDKSGVELGFSSSSCCEFVCSGCMVCVCCPLAVAWCFVKLPCQVGWRAVQRATDLVCCGSKARAAVAAYSSFSDNDFDFSSQNL